jgi:hypothetical protein
MRDRGPWSVRDDGEDILIESDDFFAHDAGMILYGDFKDRRQKKRYAREIADVLNAHIKTREGK